MKPNKYNFNKFYNEKYSPTAKSFIFREQEKLFIFRNKKINVDNSFLRMQFNKRSWIYLTAQNAHIIDKRALIEYNLFGFLKAKTTKIIKIAGITPNEIAQANRATLKRLCNLEIKILIALIKKAYLKALPGIPYNEDINAAVEDFLLLNKDFLIDILKRHIKKLPGQYKQVTLLKHLRVA